MDQRLFDKRTEPQFPSIPLGPSIPLSQILSGLRSSLESTPPTPSSSSSDPPPTSLLFPSTPKSPIYSLSNVASTSTSSNTSEKCRKRKAQPEDFEKSNARYSMLSTWSSLTPLPPPVSTHSGSSSVFASAPSPEKEKEKPPCGKKGPSFLWEKMKLILNNVVKKQSSMENPVDLRKIYFIAFRRHVRKPLLAFFEIVSKELDNSLQYINDMSDLKKVNRNLDRELSLVFYPFIQNVYPIMLGDDDYEQTVKIKKKWNDPEGMGDLGDSELRELFDFHKIFSNLTHKDNLCQEELLAFRSKQNKVTDWNLLGPSFLGRLESVFGFNSAKADPKTMSFLHLARLILFRYKKLVLSMTSIDKALKIPLQWIDYKRMIIIRICEIRIGEGIAGLYRGNALSPIFWSDVSLFTEWITQYINKEDAKPRLVALNQRKGKGGRVSAKKARVK